uniref:Uncharacterized protein n=1 Tax=Aegilops tauschii subsp. strangulata TaxID=200361 RepID=A0A453Q536_AEGTS
LAAEGSRCQKLEVLNLPTIIISELEHTYFQLSFYAADCLPLLFSGQFSPKLLLRIKGWSLPVLWRMNWKPCSNKYLRLNKP